MIRTLILVGIGGAAGSMLRYGTTLLVSKYYAQTFPLATLVANMLGCLIMGVLLGFFLRYPSTNPDIKLLLITGFCGGYTTFSAFAAENIQLMQSGHIGTALIYSAMSFCLCLFGVWIGMLIATL